MIEFKTLVGITLTEVKVNEDKDELLFKTGDGRQFKLWHLQD